MLTATNHADASQCLSILETYCIPDTQGAKALEVCPWQLPFRRHLLVVPSSAQGTHLLIRLISLCKLIVSFDTTSASTIAWLTDVCTTQLTELILFDFDTDFTNTSADLGQYQCRYIDDHGIAKQIHVSLDTSQYAIRNETDMKGDTSLSKYQLIKIPADQKTEEPRMQDIATRLCECSHTQITASATCECSHCWQARAGTEEQHTSATQSLEI
jgi:hypothetical protein